MALIEVILFLVLGLKEELSDKFEKDPNDLENRYELAVSYFEEGNYQEAINILLDIIKHDKTWNNKKANSLLIGIFNSLGSDNLMTIEGRKKLTRLLY